MANDSRIDSFEATVSIRVVLPLDTDNDGLPNEQELLAGTDPNDPDTDNDSLPDGSDPQPLIAANGPSLTLPVQIEIVQRVGTNIIVTASDPDRNLLDLRINAAEGAPVAEFFNVGRSINVLGDVNFEAAPTHMQASRRAWIRDD